MQATALQLTKIAIELKGNHVDLSAMPLPCLASTLLFLLQLSDPKFYLVLLILDNLCSSVYTLVTK